MSTHIEEQLDDWEAGELSVEFEGQEPWDLLEWAIDRFGGRLAISTAFQEGDVALIDMAYKIDPDVRVFSMDTGRLPQETFDLIEQLRDRYEGLRLELISPDAGQVQRLVDRHGPNLFFKSVENRLLCCNVRKVQPLTRALADLDAWVTGLRRDQWASRSDIRKIEIDHDHGAIVKLNPLAEWQEDEVWDYLRENEVPTHPLYEQGYTSIGCAPCTKPVAAGPARAGRTLVVGDGRPEGVRHALRDRDRRLRARAARDPRRGLACLTPPWRPAIKVSETERELALAETRAVLAAAASEEYRERAARARGGSRGGLLDDQHALTLEPILELALQAGRIRGIYGPPGETAALRLYRKLPRGVALQQSAREVSEALSSLQGHTLEGATLTAVGPGAYTLSIATAEGRLSVKLDRQGARITSVEV